MFSNHREVIEPTCIKAQGILLNQRQNLRGWASKLRITSKMKRASILTTMRLVTPCSYKQTHISLLYRADDLCHVSTLIRLFTDKSQYSIQNKHTTHYRTRCHQTLQRHCQLANCDPLIPINSFNHNPTSTGTFFLVASIPVPTRGLASFIVRELHDPYVLLSSCSFVRQRVRKFVFSANMLASQKFPCSQSAAPIFFSTKNADMTCIFSIFSLYLFAIMW